MHKNSKSSPQQSSQELLSYRQAIREISKQSIPFCLSRAAIGAVGFTNGIILSLLGDTEVSAGPIITTFTYAVMGTARGIFLSTGIIGGQLYGENRREEMGKLLKQSWMLSLILLFPAAGILLSARYVLGATGTDIAVAKAVDDYFRFYSLSILPTFFFVNDQQFALSAKKPNLVLGTSLIYSLVTFGTGYLLAYGPPSLGIKGMGIGATVGALTTLSVLRAYFLRKEFSDYHLFNRNYGADFSYLKNLIKLGLKTGLQVTVEWGNLTIITLMMGKLGKDVLTAEQPSIQYTSSYILIILGLAQATGVLVSTSVGKENIASNKSLKIIHQKNTRKLGNTAVGLGFGLSLIACTLFITIPRPLASVFIDTSRQNDDTLELMEQMLLINGIGLIFDSIRNVAAGALRGKKDVMFATILGLTALSLVALPVGGGLSLGAGLSPNYLFITRNIGIVIAAIGTMYRWFTQSKIETEEPISIGVNLPQSDGYHLLSGSEDGDPCDPTSKDPNEDVVEKDNSFRAK